MVKKIRLLLEYNTYPIWLYNEDDEVVDNDNPPEWDDDQRLTEMFMAVSDLYDTFFIDNNREFTFVGCPNIETREKLISLIESAVSYLIDKNQAKYTIQNDIRYEF